MAVFGKVAKFAKSAGLQKLQKQCGSKTMKKLLQVSRAPIERFIFIRGEFWWKFGSFCGNFSTEIYRFPPTETSWQLNPET